VDGRLADRVAVVTGAGSGIGLATVRRFASEGARVTVADIAVRPATDTEVSEVTLPIQLNFARSNKTPCRWIS